MVSKKLSDQQLEDLWNKFEETKDDEIKNKLIEHYFSFVQKIAVKLAEKMNWQVQPDELTSFGIDGLYSAIDRYSRDRGVKFESYANTRIRGSMIDGLRREDIVPRGVRIANDQYDKHKQRLQNYFGRRLSDAEFATIIGLDETEFISNTKRYIPLSFSSLEGNLDTKTQEEMKMDSNVCLEADSSFPDAKLSRKEFFSKLFGKNFSSVERKIMFLYHYEGLTMDRVADAIGLSESRVSQVHKQILQRLYDKVKRNPKYFSDDVFTYAASLSDDSSLF